MKITSEECKTINEELDIHNKAIDAAQEIEKKRRERFEMAKAVASGNIQDVTDRKLPEQAGLVVELADLIIAELERAAK